MPQVNDLVGFQEVRNTIIHIMKLCTSLVLCLLATVTPARAADFSHQNAFTLHLAHDASTLLSRSHTSEGWEELRGWDLRTNKPLYMQVFSSEQSPSILAVSPENDRIVLQLHDKEWPHPVLNTQILCAVGSKTPRLAPLTQWGKRQIIAAAFVGRRCVLAGRASIETYDLRGHRLRRVKLNAKPELFGAFLSPDGRWLLTILSGRRAVFDVHTGRLHHLLQPDSKSGLPPNTEFGFDSISPNGRYVSGHYQYIQSDGYDFTTEQPYTLSGENVGDVKTGKIIWAQIRPYFLDGDLALVGFKIYNIRTHQELGEVNFEQDWPEKSFLYALQISPESGVWAKLDTYGHIRTGRLKIVRR